MPWKEITPMNQRLEFIVAVNQDEASFSEICLRFGISRKTGYKWALRYETEGPAGLETRPSVPQNVPHRIDPRVLEQLVQLRKEHPTWGPKKLRAKLLLQKGCAVPAASTLGDWLKRMGLIRPRRRRFFPPVQPSRLSLPVYPNDLWCVDFKGQFLLGDKTLCYPLTLSDQVARYLLKNEGLAHPDEPSVRLHFERAFREFGLPWRLRSDNGPPFVSVGVGGLTALSVWWIKLGIGIERIEKGHPEQNGRHERMHRTLKQEATKPPREGLIEQQREFDRWRQEYNEVRPHEALEQKTPASQYSVSPRRMTEKLVSPSYPETMTVRRLDGRGQLCFLGQRVQVTKLLANEPVGLEAIDETRWKMVYGAVELGEVQRRGKTLVVKPVR